MSKNNAAQPATNNNTAPRFVAGTVHGAGLDVSPAVKDTLTGAVYGFVTSNPVEVAAVWNKHGETTTASGTPHAFISTFPERAKNFEAFA